mmetsp:Transcript_34444/g.67356  ORF Transcript_34444/g.67356 Transcript_34444/m.67356 type:complete len:202 (+) Transcript_34444:445-1050(+)
MVKLDHHALLRERRKPTQQNVEDDPHPPHVALLAVPFACQNLRGNVVGRPAAAPETKPSSIELIHLDQPPQAKVAHLDRRVWVRRRVEYVFGLEIAVHDTLRVQVFDRADDLDRDFGRLVLRVVILGDNPLEQMTPADELHDNVDVAIALKRLVEAYTVGVADYTHNVNLPQGEFHLVFALRVYFGHHFDGYSLLCPAVDA